MPSESNKDKRGIKLCYFRNYWKYGGFAKEIMEPRQTISVKGTLSRYTYRTGEAILKKTMEYPSSFMNGFVV